MNIENLRVGFAFCGSFCTMSKALDALEQTAARFGPVTPIVSETVAATDTRFGKAHDFMREMERLCDCRVIDSVAGAEPIGPKGLLDVLVICPCTGNTLAKLAHGVTDSSVTMAAKAHLRNGRPLVIAVSTNDCDIFGPSPERACGTSCTSDLIQIFAVMVKVNHYFSVRLTIQNGRVILENEMEYYNSCNLGTSHLNNNDWR